MLSLIRDPKFMVISLVLWNENRQKTQDNLDEVTFLVQTFGGSVSVVVTQNATRADSSTYIGKGKAHELANVIVEKEIDVAVVNDNLKSSQLYTLRRIFEEQKPEIEVWDRTDLILQIFKKNASTTEAKLQIKLADTRHKGPELYGIGITMSQQGGGIGTRGAGETNSEIMRRHWRGEIKNIEKQLEKLTTSRHRQMENRNQTEIPTVSIIGYTNSGKTTLFNLLSKKNNLTKDALFVTLDSGVGEVYLPKVGQKVFVTDTIGFIQNLPAETINAFKSTLMETLNADLLLHVIDISDHLMLDKITVVEEVLSSLGIDTKKQLYVFNKIDRPNIVNKDELQQRFASFNPQFISALSGDGSPQLVDEIQKELF
ncbi:GTPase HflX [Candidatus Shapirobacteria bacterium CG07_land_8_20_14_0_80_39_18]|uniref:GTPase HflX n=1 Tax=Candidatus Shapirobacteria bacterium CG07_land_8_20_14_0_80_39_18 TaxID=1974882 RepID=A0A2M6YQQ0_9BACT|nr:MAG: GTPase HflX [Candidatus Shapirobacteria bacterium CG07_land_8_20_14_0_80_39_18]